MYADEQGMLVPDDVDRMWDRLAERLDREDDWGDLLVDEAHAKLVREAMTRKLNHLQNQFARRKVDWTNFRSECWAAGDAGREAWFSFDRDYQDWRRRATSLQRNLTDRMPYVKDVEKRHRIARAAAYNDSHHTKTRDALRQLALAVHEHQQVTTENSEPSSADIRLWSVMDELRIPLGDGTATLSWIVQDVWSDE
jgi:hypothetical protein